MLKRSLVALSVLILLVRCASEPSTSSGSPNEVLEPVAQNSETKLETSATSDPAHQRLMQLLQSLGYEGVGLQYESPQTLDLLYRVFSDSRAANRQIKLIYTGMHMAYDNRYQSLTVGGSFDPSVILGFIQKSVLARPPQTSPKK